MKIMFVYCNKNVLCDTNIECNPPYQYLANIKLFILEAMLDDWDISSTNFIRRQRYSVVTFFGMLGSIEPSRFTLNT